MDLKNSWVEVAQDFVKFGANFGKTIIKTVKAGVDKVDELVNEKEQAGDRQSQPDYQQASRQDTGNANGAEAPQPEQPEAEVEAEVVDITSPNEPKNK